MYWNMSQQIAHHTINGCNLNVGDMLNAFNVDKITDDFFNTYKTKIKYHIILKL